MYYKTMRYYIASSLDNVANVRNAIMRLTEAGFSVTHDWTRHGRITDPSRYQAIGEAEYQGVIDADFIVFFMPTRYGSHVEFGIALASNKPIYMITNGVEFEEKTFYHLPSVHRYSDLNELLREWGIDK
jgi:hypothetical protein